MRCSVEIWLVILVEGKRWVGKRKAGPSSEWGLTLEKTSEGIFVIVGEELRDLGDADDS